MSLKEDIQAVKEELSAEEQFLESAIKTERFWNRYRRLLIGVGAAVVLGVLGYGAATAYNEYRTVQANEALVVLMEKPEDKAALEKLAANNPTLFAAFELKKALATKDTAKVQAIIAANHGVVSEIARYEAALLVGNPIALVQYAGSGEALLKELALIEAGALYLEAKQPAKAKQTLSQIPMTSPLRDLVTALEHLCVMGI